MARQRALWAIGGFLVPPRGAGAQRLSHLRRGLWLRSRAAGGGAGWWWVVAGPEAFAFPPGFSEHRFPQNRLFPLLKGSAMGRALSYTEVHSSASIGPSTLACGIWVHLPSSFLSLYYVVPELPAWTCTACLMQSLPFSSTIHFLSRRCLRVSSRWRVGPASTMIAHLAGSHSHLAPTHPLPNCLLSACCVPALRYTSGTARGNVDAGRAIIVYRKQRNAPHKSISTPTCKHE